MKIASFFRKLWKEILKKRRENQIAMQKVRDVRLYKSKDRADAFVKRETDGDGGWSPRGN
ncbi:MAG: hypothetical protein EU530_06965 [Promethearchaeota archaeon]|nr:MAG: hypothetical protein EU530_06965 [Candidatus Lokiarchaeota archaeon]